MSLSDVGIPAYWRYHDCALRSDVAFPILGAQFITLCIDKSLIYRKSILLVADQWAQVLFPAGYLELKVIAGMLDIRF